MTPRRKGSKLVNSVPKLSLAQVYPEIPGSINLNTCGDPDCGNFGVAPDGLHKGFKGPGAAQRRMLAGISNPVLVTGLGRYKLGSPSDDGLERKSTAFEYEGDPTAWSDGRTLECQHQRGNAECEIQHLILSNLHFEAEAARLRSQNGILTRSDFDLIGRVYEYFIGEFASSEGKRGGEFHTPKPVVELLVEMIEPMNGRLYRNAADRRRGRVRLRSCVPPERRQARPDPGPTKGLCRP